MEKGQRHALGAHYTSEADIQRIIGPTIVRPWQEQIDNAKSEKQLSDLRESLKNFRVLDPACGSGNFLYVSFREMAKLDIRILSKLRSMLPDYRYKKYIPQLNVISPKQFFGLEIDEFGAELAKVTLMLAKKLAMDDAVDALSETQAEDLQIDMRLMREDNVLPLDNLDDNIRCADALFATWPEAEVIVGNPPYQSKNKSQKELTVSYLHKLRARFPDTDGRSDFCVHWFRLAHDHLKPGHRAGLVGTNTIRQNYTRVDGLDYILADEGTITEAVSSMVWPGEANLHVSVVNWIKGDDIGKKRLYLQLGNNPDEGWSFEDVEVIGSSLSFQHDVTKARSIDIYAKLGGCYQGQTHGHKGFLMTPTEAKLWIAQDKRYASVLKPFLIADDLIGELHSKPTRYVIDMNAFDLLGAKAFKRAFERIEKTVLPTRKKAAEEESARNKQVLAENSKAKVNHHHRNFLKRWWTFSYSRPELMLGLSQISRYIACGQVTLRPIFDFVSSKINPNAALQVFLHDDDYSFGILQSDAHWLWFTNRCSTLTERYRYTSNTVFDSFPWPQKPSAKSVRQVADAAIALRELRSQLRKTYKLSLRELYRSLELPGEHPLKEAHAILDKAVRKAYGFTPGTDLLAEILDLNLSLTDSEDAQNAVAKPGLPAFINDRSSFVSGDMVTA